MRAMQKTPFLILTSLAAGSRHGYAIIIDVHKIFQGQVRPRAGTLCTALGRLHADDPTGVAREEIVDNRLRRYYRLSGAGNTRLAEEADRLRSHAPAAISRLKLARGATTP